MPKSAKARISDGRWKQKNLLVVGCKLYRGDAEAFKEYAAAQGRSINEILREYIASCLGRPLERRTKGDAPPEGDGE